MIDFESKKFLSLSNSSKLIILYANATGKKIKWSKPYANLLGLKFPDEELFFIQNLQEIERKRINYKIEKLQFKPPTLQEVEFFLRIMKNKLKKSFSLPEIKHFSLRFFDYYEKKKWTKQGVRIYDWKKELIYAANNWNDKLANKSENSSSYNLDEELNKAFGHS